MAQNISPGVYHQFNDLSEYVQNVPGTIGFIPIISEKGPDNQLVFTNARDFFLDYGEPDINYLNLGRFANQGKYVAASYLKQSDSLYVIRVLPTDATIANLMITASIGGDYDGTATVTASSAASINTELEMRTLFTNAFESDGPDHPDTGNPDPDVENCVIFYGNGRGDWYNRFRVDISPHENTIKASEGVWILDIYERQKTDNYDNSTGSFTPAYAILHSFEVSFDPDAKDLSGNNIFVEEIVNRYSRYIKCVADRVACQKAIAAGADWSEPFVTTSDGGAGESLDNGTVGGLAATSGVTGWKNLLARAYTGSLEKAWRNYKIDEDDGTISTSYETAVDEVLDDDFFYFNVVLDAGYPTDIKQQAVALCVQRQDCLAILDNGDNNTPQEAIDRRKGTPGNPAAHSFNTFFAALYEGYTRIYDIYTDRNIWVSPVYHMANIIPYTDRVTELWYAPAGFNRGTISEIKDFRYSPRKGWRDQFYLQQLNPIVQFSVGNVVWGQLTTQRRPTALQDVNIVRLVLYIKRALDQFCKFYIFEQNDAQTWNAISNNINKFLKEIQNKRGLYSYSVEVGANEYEIQTKQIHVKCGLRPVRVVERINIGYNIT